MPSARRFCLGACALSVTALSTPRDALSCVRFLAQGLGGQLPGGGEGRADARHTPVLGTAWASQTLTERGRAQARPEGGF